MKGRTNVDLDLRINLNHSEKDYITQSSCDKRVKGTYLKWSSYARSPQFMHARFPHCILCCTFRVTFIVCVMYTAINCETL